MFPQRRPDTGAAPAPWTPRPADHPPAPEPAWHPPAQMALAASAVCKASVCMTSEILHLGPPLRSRARTLLSRPEARDRACGQFEPFRVDELSALFRDMRNRR